MISLPDDFVVTQKPDVNWYEQSSELTILVNCEPRSAGNSLWALPSYGSHCWRRIQRGVSIGDMRRSALKVFGRDHVEDVIARLEVEGFIAPLPFGYPSAVKNNVDAGASGKDVQYTIPFARIPWYCLWEICSKCNFRCRTCYLPNFSHGGPDKSETAEIMRQLKNLRSLHVCIFGGEPLLREDIFSIVEQLRDEHLFVKIISNGSLLTAHTAHALALAELNLLEISFDGLRASTHDACRGPTTFNMALRALKTAQEAGIARVGIVLTLHSGNLHELEELPDFMVEHKIAECFISPFKKTGLMGQHAPFNPLRPGEIQFVRGRLDAWQGVNGLSFEMLPTCACGRSSVVISHNGDIRLCSFSYNKIGNIYSEELGEVWENLGSGSSEPKTGYCGLKNVSNAIQFGQDGSISN